MVLSSFKTSLRSLTRYRFYTLLNIVGFSLGLTLVIYIGLYLYEQFSYDKWYPEHDRIYRVEFGDWALLGPVYSRVISSSSADIEQVLRVNNNFGTNAPVTLEDQPNTFRIPSLLLADSSFFDFFPFQFLAGTAQTALKDKFSIVVTRSEAVRLFGSVDAVGKIVRLHDRHPLTVTGVIEDVQLFHLKFDAVTSFSLFENIYSPQYMESTGNWNHNTYIKTHPEANPELIAQNIEKTAIDYINELFGTVPDWNINLRPIADIYFTDAKMHESMVVHGNKTVSYVLLIIAVFILGIAVINYMNLSTARSAGRSRETGIRKLLGSTRNGLMMRYYAETLLITFVAVILALLLVEV
ncbi:MAG: ABC transporter permease, partial [Bacteroidota bacterium]